MSNKLKLFGKVLAMGDTEADAPNGWVEGIGNAFIVDRYREVILPEAFSKAADGFMANPVLTGFHELDKFPFGTVLKLWQDAKLNTCFKARWADTPDAQMCRKLYVAGDMRAFSVQFIPKASRRPTDDEQKKWPGAEVIITEVDLLEIACCAVPVNPGSLATASKSMSPTTASLHALAANQEPGMKLSLTDEAKGHLARVQDAFNRSVKSMTGVAESLDELSAHAKEGGEAKDAQELSHAMGVHAALARRCMRSMHAAHKDLAESLGTEAPADDTEDPEDANTETAEEKKALDSLDFKQALGV